MNRRNFVMKAGLGTAAIGITPYVSLTSCTNDECSSKQNDEPVLKIGDNIAIAETSYGKVKGYILNDVYTFLGIPYGADTAGKNRFMPPKEPQPWDDIRPAVFYGNSAPQDIYPRKPENYYSFVDHWNYDEVSEDCLRLNIWTPAIDNKKRPVLIWLHGGGYSRGNGIEQDGYHGENLSKYGDVVFCSINHRLGAMGFSDLSGVGGDKYKYSGNAGVLDILAAIRWVNKNISNFGGDPGNVTVMGQSGGGAKVCLAAAMPEAKGLVHKGVALSGSTIECLDQNDSRKLGEYILKEAGLNRSEIDKLQDLPWRDYLDLAYKAAHKFEQDLGNGRRRGSFQPVADGINLPDGKFWENPNFNSPDIPLLLCSTFHEWAPGRHEPELHTITLEGVKEKLKARYGDKTNKIVDAFAKQFPGKEPIEIWALIVSNRIPLIETADAKLKQNSPVYVAWFGWEPPLFDGRMRSSHCLDISFWFKNTDLMVTHSGGGARPRRLSDKMADALLNFMRSGDPNCKALPEWPKYTMQNCETMILNDECKVENNPDGEARKALVGT